MKITVENKKGLNKNLKVFIDKKTINSYFEERYEELKKNVVLKDTSSKALEENKIKPAGQPKIDLKTYGEDKDLEYIISVTELPKIELSLIHI